MSLATRFACITDLYIQRQKSSRPKPLDRKQVFWSNGSRGCTDFFASFSVSQASFILVLQDVEVNSFSFAVVDRFAFFGVISKKCEFLLSKTLSTVYQETLQRFSKPEGGRGTKGCQRWDWDWEIIAFNFLLFFMLLPALGQLKRDTFRFQIDLTFTVMTRWVDEIALLDEYVFCLINWWMELCCLRCETTWFHPSPALLFSASSQEIHTPGVSNRTVNHSACEVPIHTKAQQVLYIEIATTCF